MKSKYFKKNSSAPDKKVKFPSLIFDSTIPDNKIKYFVWVFLGFSLILELVYILNLYLKYNILGFPLDDPWIHLTFAKNLIEYGSFSYFKNEMATSGSTSPVYTIVLAIFYIVIRNEFLVSYFLGIGFALISVYFYYKLAGVEFNGSTILILFAALLFVFQPKIHQIAVSGMETTMFLAFIILTLYYYRNFNKYLLGLFLGLLIWCRPDGIVLWIAILIDLAYNIFINSKSQKNKLLSLIKKDHLITIGIASGLVGLYFLFNLYLSGSILPNTYRAKIEYYRPNLRSKFLEDEVLGFFTSSEYSLLFIPFLIGLIFIVKSLIKKENNPYLVYFLFVIGLVLVYYIKLPFAHRFGRYLIPVIPAFLIVVVYGIKSLIEYISELKKGGANKLLNNLLYLYLLVLVVVTSISFYNKGDEFSLISKYHDDRHVKISKWLPVNTPKNSVICTHDVGAIGFYSNRKIIDMAGLMTPELINHLNDKDYLEIVSDYLKKNKATHIVLLKNWYEIGNDNPLYSPVKEPEFLEVYKFQPGKTHFVPREVSAMNEQGIMMMQQSNFESAVQIFKQSLSVDSKTARTYLLLGAAYDAMQDNAMAEQYYKLAVTYFPGYAEAYFGLANLQFRTKKFDEARINVMKCLSLKSDFEPALELLPRIPKQ